MKIEREEYMKWAETVNPEDLVFLDESGINCGMTRLYGRAQSDERVKEYVPDIRFERYSILSSVRLNGNTCPFVFKGTLNGDLFEQYITECLVPTLKHGDIVVMDNLSAHKREGVIADVESVGASVKFLSRYSPDFNPIELMWSKIKSTLRKLKARTSSTLIDALTYALWLICPSDCDGWFSHCGY